MLMPDMVPRRREGVLAQHVMDKVVLLDPANGQYYALDEVSGRIWELCDGEHSVAELSSVISREFDAPAEVITADVLELLDDLAGEQLLVAGR